jgi:hypothetical protein
MAKPSHQVRNFGKGQRKSLITQQEYNARYARRQAERQEAKDAQIMTPEYVKAKKLQVRRDNLRRALADRCRARAALLGVVINHDPIWTDQILLSCGDESVEVSTYSAAILMREIEALWKRVHFPNS